MRYTLILVSLCLLVFASAANARRHYYNDGYSRHYQKKIYHKRYHYARRHHRNNEYIKEQKMNEETAKIEAATVQITFAPQQPIQWQYAVGNAVSEAFDGSTVWQVQRDECGRFSDWGK